jgi:putative acetyltransferase
MGDARPGRDRRLLRTQFFAGELSRLYVHKDHLRKGIGSCLLAVAEASLKRQGCKEVTPESTMTAKGFYAAKGYRLVKTKTL